MAIGDKINFYPAADREYQPRIVRAYRIPQAELFNALYPGNRDDDTDVYGIVTEDNELIIGLFPDPTKVYDRMADLGINLDLDNETCNE